MFIAITLDVRLNFSLELRLNLKPDTRPGLKVSLPSAVFLAELYLTVSTFKATQETKQ
jgi:hypothetical protein